ncbi:MAG: hypothetical protein ACKO5R_07395 [Planctomycetaceae bacterium]
MATPLPRSLPTVPTMRVPAAALPTAAALAVVAAAAFVAGAFPIAFSVAIVFLFAGPHNWLESRYFLSRMPGRWGRLQGYFLLGIGGVVTLTLTMIALPAVATALGDGPETWRVLLACWNSALVLWVATLASRRARQRPRRDWPWLWPAACLAIAAAWLWPVGWGLGLVYLHPLLALAFLDAELGRRRPELRPAYRRCLVAVPAAIVLLAWRLGAAPDLAGSDVLTAQITRHAGAGIVPHLSTHFLVAAHTFLEMLHYAVWCVALPALAIGGRPWRVGGVPLARRSAAWRRGLGAVLATGAVVVAAFWVGFLVDYPLTRSLYFTLALAHVLAEVPFLLREA